MKRLKLSSRKFYRDIEDRNFASMIASGKFEGAKITDGMIGIFWVIGNEVIAYPIEGLSQNAEISGKHITSPQLHCDLWEDVIKTRPGLSDFRYDTFPRGRVSFERWRLDGRKGGTFCIGVHPLIRQNTQIQKKVLKAFSIAHAHRPNLKWEVADQYEDYSD